MASSKKAAKKVIKKSPVKKSSAKKEKSVIKKKSGGDNKSFVKRTISEALYEAWLANTRPGDLKRIIELAQTKEGVPDSKPVINKALLYGYCVSSELRDLITQYFKDRHAEEEKQARELNSLKK